MPIIDDEKVKTELKKRAENYYPRGIDLPIILQNTDLIKDFNAFKTAEVIGNIVHNHDSSQSEKNVALNYLWIRAVKRINDSNTVSVLPKAQEVKEEDLLQILTENRTDEEIKSFFDQQAKQSVITILEQIMSFDNSILSQEKLVLIKENLDNSFSKTPRKVSSKKDLLFCVAKNGYTSALEILLEDEQIDVNQANQNGVTALIIAAQSGRSEVVEKLLNFEQIDVNQHNMHGNTALMFAAYYGHLEVVEKLLAASNMNGINLNQFNQNGDSALMLAARNGHFEVVDKIVQKLCIDGIDPKDIDYIEGDRPKIFSDADKILSFFNQISSFIKPAFNFSEAGQKKLELLVRKSLFKEIFADENKENVDFIIAHFAQERVAENIANTITARLQSSERAIEPSRSRFSLIPGNNPKTLNTEHEGVKALVSDPIKELINQVLAPDPGSFIANQSGVRLGSQQRER